MALLEYLMFKYSKGIQEVIDAPQGDNQKEVYIILYSSSERWDRYTIILYRQYKGVFGQTFEAIMIGFLLYSTTAVFISFSSFICCLRNTKSILQQLLSHYHPFPKYQHLFLDYYL